MACSAHVVIWRVCQSVHAAMMAAWQWQWQMPEGDAARSQGLRSRPVGKTAGTCAEPRHAVGKSNTGSGRAQHTGHATRPTRCGPSTGTAHPVHVPCSHSVLKTDQAHDSNAHSAAVAVTPLCPPATQARPRTSHTFQGKQASKTTPKKTTLQPAHPALHQQRLKPAPHTAHDTHKPKTH